MMIVSGAPSGDFTRRSKRLAASSPIRRASDGDGRQRRPMHRAFGDVVETDDCDVAARPEPAIDEADHDPERAEIVMAKNGGRLVRSCPEQSPDRFRAVLPGRHAVDDRAERQPVARQGLVERLRPVARRRNPPSAADEGDPLVAEPDQVLGGESHTEPKIRADMIGVLRPSPPQHLNDRNALAAQLVEACGRGALGRREQDAVDAVLAHPRDEPLLPRRRFRRVGEKRHPPGLVQRLVDPRRQFGVEGVSDLADDEADRVRQARPEIGGGAMVDIAESVDRSLDLGPRRLGHQRTLSQDERNGGGRNSRMLGNVPHRCAQSCLA